MEQAQADIRKATPRQIAGVLARLGVSLTLVLAGVLVASVPFLMQFAKTCPYLFGTSTIIFDRVDKCEDRLAGAIHTFSAPGWEFIGSAALLFAMIGILRRCRQQAAARREME